MGFNSGFKGLKYRNLEQTLFYTVHGKKRISQFIQKNPTRCNSVSKFIIPYLYEAQHVSGDTPPIIRSQILH